MAEEILLELTKREVTGKAVKRLREEGFVPAVVHDHGKESLHVQGNYLDVLKAYQKAGRHHVVNLNADGKKYTALIRDVDIDPKKHQLRHIVFNAVKADEKVDAKIPVHIRYAEGHESTPAERAGLVVLNQLDEVEVEALPRDLPDFVEFDAEKLVAVGDSLTVADLIVPAKVTIKTDAGHPVATVFEPSALAAANDAAGGTAEEETVAEEPAEGEAPANGEAQAKSEENKE